jgi:hypothetical protein
VRITRTKTRLVLRLGKRETQLFFGVLKLYPRVPAAHQTLSKSTAFPDPEWSQRLLDEALAEQRAANKKALHALLKDPCRSKKLQSGHRLSLSEADVEWLLQILNDIRIGSWVLLGSPEANLEWTMLTEETAPHFWAMQTAGHFQMQLLGALGGFSDGESSRAESDAR